MSCFSIALYTHKYIGYALFALIGEVNSIFLHARQLMLMMNYTKSSLSYQLNGIINVITFVIFRFGVIFHMSHWLYMHAHLIPTLLIGIGSFGLLAMAIINAVLFKRLLCSDYLDKRKDLMANGDLLSN